MRKVITFSVFLIFVSLNVLAQKNSLKDSIAITKLWDKAPHNAFPDLFKHKKFFYVAFRESTSHVGNENDGKVRVLRSRNLKEWETVTQFHLPGIDIREARLSAT